MKNLVGTVEKSLCLAIEELEDFRAAHRDWRYVRNEADALVGRLEKVLSDFESLLREMDEELSYEANMSLK